MVSDNYGTLHHYSRTSHFRQDFWDFLSLGKVGPCYFSYRIQVSYGEYLSSNEKDYSRCPRNQFLRLNTPWDSSQGQVFSYTHPVLVCRFEPIGDASELWWLDWYMLLFYFLKPLIFAFHTEMKEAFSCHFEEILIPATQSKWCLWIHHCLTILKCIIVATLRLSWLLQLCTDYSSL